MTTEEKAKCYDGRYDIEVKTFECLFPELKESEDDRIRKSLLDYLHTLPNHFSHNGSLVTDWIAWLEKQGEQNHTDKVEPKFNVGDWLIQNERRNIVKVVSRTQLDYEAVNTLGQRHKITSTAVENNYHLWTIQDAKDGDVLCYKDEISLYKHDIKNCTKQETTFGGFVYHCCYDGKRFIIDSLYSLTEQDKIDIHPATKGQHDLLFQKMHEARYEWDAEKKELKKIEQKPTIEPKFKVGDYIDRKDGLGCHAKIIVVGKNVYGCEKLIYSEDESPFFDLMFENQDEFRISPDFQQNHTWSEEDEEMFEKILQQFMAANNECKLHNASFTYDKEISFLKSLKGRVQPKQEWSEEDESNLDSAIYHIRREPYRAKDVEPIVDWLRTLKERYTWKPSDEQMEVLSNALSLAKNCGEEGAFGLRTLYEQLKKLKED